MTPSSREESKQSSRISKEKLKEEKKRRQKIMKLGIPEEFWEFFSLLWAAMLAEFTALFAMPAEKRIKEPESHDLPHLESEDDQSVATTVDDSQHHLEDVLAAEDNERLN
jgi:hypothetical protein